MPRRRRNRARGYGKPDPRRGRKENQTQSRYCGNGERCPTCGETYGNFKTGLTYFEVWLMFWDPPDTPPDEWKYATRGVVLGKWFQIKQEWWERHKEECEQQAEHDTRDDFDPVPFHEEDMSDVPF